MKKTSFFYLLLLSLFYFYSSVSLASQLRFGGSYSLNNSYEFGDLESKFDSKIMGLDINYMFIESSAVSSLSEDLFSSFLGFWGLGFNYTNFNTKIKSRGTTDFISPNSFSLDMFSGQVIFGLKISAISIEIPLSLTVTRENASFNSGDEKYGVGYGANLYYQLTPSFQMGLGYEAYRFKAGKNSSTGQSGSLANAISLSNTKLVLTYSFDLGGGDVGPY